MDFQTICRICLEASKPCSDLFSSYYPKNNTLYSEMLSSCTKIKPYPEDGLPRLICKECTKQLKRTYIFNQLCEESNKTLCNYLKNTKANGIETSLETDNKDDVKIEEECFTTDDAKQYEDQNVLEMLDQNVVIEDGIKIEPNDISANDSFWDAEDNILLGDVKLNNLSEEAESELPLENSEPLKKKRGRKKRVLFKGQEAPLPESKCPHQCDICGKVLSNKSNLKAHKLCHTDLRPYSCSDCPATFRGYSALFQHKKVHSGETPYHCEYCPKQFSRRTGLVNHIRMHTGEKHFSCDICFKTFVQSAQLSIHMKRHKGDKPYLCQDCGKGFPIKSDLRVHQRIHNGEKPYSCHMCTKTFATSGNLSIHIRIHKKEIRYNCKECHRGFVTNSAYNVHLKRHKGQRDYHCECGKTFYTSSALKQHKVVHTGEKKYQCKICDRKFTQTSHLSRHFKRDHAKPNMPLPASEHYKLVVQDTSFGLIENAIGVIGVKCEETLA